jgi:transcription antitermination protein NusB
VTTKRKSREIALQILFAWDATGELDEPMALRLAHDASPDDVDVRLRALDWARGAWENRETIDAQLERLAPQWPPRRQPAVDRNLLRLAAWELTSSDTPPKVVIDEAIELAKQFSTENSPSFVNGVLDAILRERTGLTSPVPPPGTLEGGEGGGS